MDATSSVSHRSVTEASTSINRQFVQLPPACREDRVALWSKESLEIHRLKNRREKHVRVDPGLHPLEQTGGSLNPAKASETEMFERDAAAMELDKRSRCAQTYKVGIQNVKLSREITAPIAIVRRDVPSFTNTISHQKYQLLKKKTASFRNKIFPHPVRIHRIVDR